MANLFLLFFALLNSVAVGYEVMKDLRTYFENNCESTVLTQSEVHHKKCTEKGICFYSGSQSYRTDANTELCSSIFFHSTLDAQMTAVGDSGDWSFVTFLFGDVSKAKAAAIYERKFGVPPAKILKGYVEVKQCICPGYSSAFFGH